METTHRSDLSTPAKDRNPFRRTRAIASAAFRVSVFTLFLGWLTWSIVQFAARAGFLLPLVCLGASVVALGATSLLLWLIVLSGKWLTRAARRWDATHQEQAPSDVRESDSGVRDFDSEESEGKA